MLRANAKEVNWEKVLVCGEEALFADERVDRNSVPSGYYMYEVRHDDDCQGDPVQIARSIFVNFWGTILVKEPFVMDPDPISGREFLDINPEKDWDYIGDFYSIADGERLLIRV